MATYTVKNTQPFDMWLNLPDKEDKERLTRDIRLPPRGTLELTEEEFVSLDVQAKLREGVLVLLCSE